MLDLVQMVTFTVITAFGLFSTLYSKFYPYPPIKLVQLVCLHIKSAFFHGRRSLSGSRLGRRVRLFKNQGEGEGPDVVSFTAAECG